jgi:hypothetical protein
MTAENGNGEVKQLVEIKRAYRQGLIALDDQLRAEYDRALVEGAKKLKEKYLEQVVDTVFAEPAQVAVEVKKATVSIAPRVEIETEVTPKPTPALPVTSCPECGITVDVRDKFCSQCGAPLKEDEKNEGPSMEDFPVVSASRKFRPRRR